MERIISKQLINFALKHNVIPPQQHGFLPGRSAVTCLLECVNDWTLEIDNFRPVDVLYLDFEKAFDRVPHQRLLVKLSHFGIRGHLLKWIQALPRYFSNLGWRLTIVAGSSVLGGVRE
jgi:hypothetical protein